MKKRILSLFLAVLMCLTSVFWLASCKKQNNDTDADTDTELKDKGSWTVTSPDGSISAVMTMDGNGKMTYTVQKNGATVIGKSEMGFDIEEDDFNMVTIHKESSRKASGSYANISGKTDEVSYSCNETTITLKGWEFYLDITMRAYDDGYAFRYGIRRIDGTSGTMTVINEKTQFAFPKDATMWAQEYVTSTEGKNCFSYETAYQGRVISDLNDAQYIAMPLLYNIPGTDYYSLVTESELIGSGFYGSFLKVQEGNTGSGVLRTEHTPAGIKIDDNKVEYPFESPWRVGITGDMATVNESELVEKVYDDVEYWKPDNYEELSDEEKEIYNYDWVESGVCAWSWLIYNGTRGQNDFSLHREYLALAKEMGWTYVLLDGGWNSGLDDATFASFMEAADKAGVKVLVWCNALSDFGNGNTEILRAKLQKWANFGVAGIKIDFFDGQNATDPKHQGEDIDTIKWYETIYQETAKLKMVVNCHGSNKPTGERRQYPNVINREGIYGNEFKRVSAAVTVNELFVRNVIGPSDFTPVVNPLSTNLTAAHQMALSILYESGSPSMGDYPSAYRNATIYSFYKSIPSLREKTVFLGGQPDYYYSAAVKAGDYWFVGIANALIEDTVTINFSFLDDGEYTAEIYTDDESGRSVVKETVTVTKNDSRTFNLLAKGGAVIRLQKKS